MCSAVLAFSKTLPVVYPGPLGGVSRTGSWIDRLLEIWEPPGADQGISRDLLNGIFCPVESTIALGELLTSSLDV